jgi:hypothetical protein
MTFAFNNILFPYQESGFVVESLDSPDGCTWVYTGMPGEIMMNVQPISNISLASLKIKRSGNGTFLFNAVNLASPNGRVGGSEPTQNPIDCSVEGYLTTNSSPLQFRLPGQNCCSGSDTQWLFQFVCPTPNLVVDGLVIAFCAPSDQITTYWLRGLNLDLAPVPPTNLAARPRGK